ncbi:MAG: BatD family protein, partial [Sedimenticolaceae bacterium]
VLSMPAAADVRARLDRDKVYVGDPVTLVIVRSGASSGEPDLSPLNKDFRVLGTGTSTQFSFVNGRSSNRTTWTVQLGPLQEGKLRIPPIQVGAEQTAALELEVTEIPEQLAAQQSGQLFLEAEVDAGDHAYVQQQIPYTLRLYHAEPLLNGDLRPPQIKDALTRQLGDERRYTVTRNNRRYQVVERRYTISPEKSGELRIPPATFSGQLSAALQGPGRSSPLDSLRQQFFRNSPFGNGGKSVRISSKAITIDVLPRPAAAGNSWLPAEDLELQDSWASDPPRLRTGEPVSRTISLRATGLSGTQIPALEIESPKHTRVYPETPVNESHTDGDKVFASSRQTFTYIPGQAGELTIPAVEVHWWDTRSDEQATARLPQWVVKVEPGASGTQSRTNEVPPPARQSAVPAEKTRPDPQQPGEGWFEQIKAFPWHWVLLALLALAALWLARGWLGSRKGGTAEVKSKTVEKRPGPASSIANILPQLQRACEANDARKAAQALLELGRARWPNDPPRSLGQVAGRLGHGREQISILDRALYAADASTWTGADLWASVENAWNERAMPKKTAGEPLQPLYPHSS